MTHRDEFGEVVDCGSCPRSTPCAPGRCDPRSLGPPAVPERVRKMWGVGGAGPGRRPLSTEEATERVSLDVIAVELSRAIEREHELADLRYRLRFGTESEFSVSFKPAECEILLAALDATEGNV